MARNFSRIYTATGRLVARSPIHVGGLDGGNPDSDMPLAVDGQGKYYIPGTSLAGALRQWTEVEQGASVARSLWGSQESDMGDASLFTVEDSIVRVAVLPEVRDGVGIDKKTGAAQRGIKYDTTILPRGTQIEFQCSVSVIHDSDGVDTEGALRLLVEALQSGRIRIGAQRTRGMGKVVLEDCRVTVAQMNTRQGIIDHLQGHDKAVTVESLHAPRAAGGHRIEVAIYWHPTEPLMVKSGVDGIAVDGLPLVSSVDGDHVALVMPGSSIKGVLSSRASLIVRTMTGHDSEDGSRKADTVLDRLFGTSRAKVTPKDAKDAPEDAVEGMGMMAVDDCYAKVSIDRVTWEAFTTALDDKDVRRVLESAHLENKLQEVYHVAIDRWTGGASDQKLFNQMEPQGIEWEPIYLSLDLSRLSDPAAMKEVTEMQKRLDQEQKGMVALLLLVLRDMACGRMPLGFGTNRGMGSMAVDRIVLTPLGVSWMEEGANLDKGDIATLPVPLIEDLDRAWQTITADHGGA